MINLWISVYEITEELKQREFLQCLKKNIDNEHINKIYMLDESDQILPFKSEKLHRFVVVNRPTYNDFFKFINRFEPKAINIIANSDIYFDYSISFVNLMSDNDCYALSRYENNKISVNECKVSQDTWIFKNKINPIKGDYLLGWFGCDNKIAYEIKIAEYNITNPCLTIKTHHLHNSSRTWDTNQKQIPEPHCFVEPCEILANEIQYELNF